MSAGDVPVNVNFPFEFDGRGRTRDPQNAYAGQLIEQVLFTSPGERLNMPDFGSGLLQLPFAPASAELEAATQFAVQASLQKWLSDYIVVQSVVASAHEGQLSVKVTYSLVNQDVTQVQTFVSGGAA
jgi:phage baseplate assembly protein W